MKKLPLGILLAFLTVGVLFPNFYASLFNKVTFGSISYPTSLDSFTNPSATTLVSASPSHSTQHANENDGITALETKLGITASTPLINTILVGSGTGASLWSTSATSTNFLATNFSTASSTTGSTSIQTLLSINATSTNLFVSNIASTTNFYANVGNIGKSTINNLTVTTCTGCSTGSITMYIASTTAGTTYKAKTLNLISGDIVNACMSGFNATNIGNLAFRISSPWAGSTTTPLGTSWNASGSAGALGACINFLATTTETVTFEAQVGDAGATRFMSIQVQNSTYNQQF